MFFVFVLWDSFLTCRALGVGLSAWWLIKWKLNADSVSPTVLEPWNVDSWGGTKKKQANF